MIMLIYLIVALIAPEFAFADALNLTPPDSDPAVNYLSYVFGLIHNGILVGTANSLVGSMFGAFNTAILALASILLIYTVLVATLNTAHEGEFLGKKWSSIWIPVRTFAGVALLVPQSTGYSIIQVVTMWIVLQGVGAANNLWSTALTQMSQGSSIVQITQTVDSSMAQGQVAGIFRAMTCLYGLQNMLIQNSSQVVTPAPSGGTTPAPTPPAAVPTDLASTMLNPSIGSTQIVFPAVDPVLYPAYSNLNGVCGTLSWPNDKFVNIRRQGIQQILLLLNAPAQILATHTCQSDGDCFNNQKCLISGGTNYKPTMGSVKWCACKQGDTSCSIVSQILPQDAFYFATQAYQQAVYPAFKSQALDDPNNDFIDNAKKAGWIMAGRYYFDVTQLNNTINGIVTLPAGGNGTTPVPQSATDVQTLLSVNTNIKPASLADYVIPLLSPNGHVDQYVNAAKNYTPDPAFNRNAGTIDLRTAMGAVLGNSSGFFAPILDGITNTFSSLNALSSNSSQNPIILLAQVGNSLINTAMTIWISMIAIAFATSSLLALIPSVNMSGPIGIIMTMITPLLTAIILLYFSVGVGLAYYVPLIPFILFTFGVIGWFIAVIESMIASPLVAFGLAYPEGHEAFGKAESAVMIILNVFLRPMLMIFGLIGGIILSYIGIWILNAGFGYAMMGLNKTASSYPLALVIAPIALIVIYAITAIAIANQAFALINELPDKITRWISGGTQEQFGSNAGTNLQRLENPLNQVGRQAGGAFNAESAQEVGKFGAKISSADGGAAGRATTNTAAKAQNATLPGNLGGGGRGGVAPPDGSPSAPPSAPPLPGSPPGSG